MTAVLTLNTLQRDFPKARLANHTIHVNCTPEEFYTVVSDYESYPDFVPSQRSATILTRDNSGPIDRFTVQMELALVKQIRYQLRAEGVPGQSLTWSLVDGDFMKQNVGSWLLEERPDGSTHATFQMAVVLKGWLPKSLVNTLINKTCPATVKAFKAEAERRFR